MALGGVLMSLDNRSARQHEPTLSATGWWRKGS
jgi:hypothetical protein